MTHILFLHGCDDRFASSAAWLATERKGRRVMVYAPDPAVAERIDRLLWTVPALGFQPHCNADSTLAAETPILIGNSPDMVSTDQLLVNLSHEVPPGFARFETLVEFIGTSESEKVPGRERFRFYRERGYALDSRNMADSA